MSRRRQQHGVLSVASHAKVVLLVLLPALAAASAERGTYELAGRILPGARASVSLYGATTPFSTSTLSDTGGRFRFRDLLPGAYTLAVFLPGQGEARRTIEVGPSLADSRGRVSVTVDLGDSDLISHQALARRHVAPARQLSVPDPARREFDQALKKLSRRDVSGAVAHLERAVHIAPQYAAAWNHLGTIAYQTREYPRAESHFRKALERDPEAFEPLVNLGGVLLNLDKGKEALAYNRHAVLSRPNDALANSQLGLNYFTLGDLDRAVKHLTHAKRLDPSHFSHPQLTLAEIHLRRQNRPAAAAELEDFAQRHPDAPQAAKAREAAAKLRAEP